MKPGNFQVGEPMPPATPPAGPSDEASFSPADLAARRAAARRLGWWLGVAVLAIYLLGLLIPR